MPGRVELKPLPPEAAIRAFRRRGATLAPSFAWQDTWQDEHARAFTVAKTTGFDLALDVLAALEAGVRQALEQGRTLRQFQDELTPILQRLGWWGRKPLYDDKTERTREVQLGSPRRLRIIFDTNLRVSHAAASWERAQRLKGVFPYLRYTAVLDQRTRPMHAHWHGTILPVDHAWWHTHFPPNGWNCRCSVMQISARDLARRGWTVTEPAPSAPERTFVNRRTGRTETVPEGIDPGWAYNPGAAALRAQAAAHLLEKTAAAEPAIAAAVVPPILAARSRGRSDVMADVEAGWRAWLMATPGPGVPNTKVVGLLSLEVIEGLKRELGIDVQSAAIAVSRGDLSHVLRPRRATRSGLPKTLPTDAAETLPRHFFEPQAVVWDIAKRSLLYAFDVPGDPRYGKWVARVNVFIKEKGAGIRQRRAINRVITGGFESPTNLVDRKRFILLAGKVD